MFRMPNQKERFYVVQISCWWKYIKFIWARKSASYVKGRNLEIKTVGCLHNFHLFCGYHISLGISFVHRKISWNKWSSYAGNGKGTCLLQDTWRWKPWCLSVEHNLRLSLDCTHQHMSHCPPRTSRIKSFRVLGYRKSVSIKSKPSSFFMWNAFGFQNIEWKLLLLKGKCFREIARRNEDLSYKYFASMIIVLSWCNFVLYFVWFLELIWQENFMLKIRKKKSDRCRNTRMCKVL